MKTIIKVWIYLTIAVASVICNAQESKNSELYKTLQKKDSLIFEESFNKCNHKDMINLISEDLEFYHDTGGITTGKEIFISTVKQNICGNPKVKPTRKLVQESLEVFPLYKNGVLYGAIQKGDHNFYLTENGNTRPTVSAKFTHLWILENKEWMLKRVLSYDHQPIQN